MKVHKPEDQDVDVVRLCLLQLANLCKITVVVVECYPADWWSIDDVARSKQILGRRIGRLESCFRGGAFIGGKMEDLGGWFVKD